MNETKNHKQFAQVVASNIFCILTLKLAEDVQFDDHIFQISGDYPPTSLFS